MQIEHPDGTALGGTLVQGHGHGASRWVVIAGATAVPHRFYQRLADWLGETLGVNVLSFDYRGVGASRPGDLRGYRATLRDWASDLQAVIDHAADRGPTAVIGHSFGGHAFGMTPAHRRTRGLYSFGTGSGWHGWMSPIERFKAWAMWHLISPVLVATHGYLAYSKLGAEDLPLGVYRDWKRWCHMPRYFFDDPHAADFVGEFARVEAPVIAVNSVDDPWAGPRSAEVFFSRYPGHRRVTIDPATYGLTDIGHMAYVRPSCAVLWPELARWLAGRLDLGVDMHGLSSTG